MKAALLTIAMASAAATNLMAADGKALYTQKGCPACHGATGAEPTTPMYPKIKGQSEQYLTTQIQDIKSGKRSNGMSATMKPMVAALTDDEIKAIAKFLAGGK